MSTRRNPDSAKIHRGVASAVRRSEVKEEPQKIPQRGLSRRELVRLGLLSAASGSLGEVFAARPARASGGMARFAIIGDYGYSRSTSSRDPEGDVARLVKSWDPEFIVTNGDNNYGDKTYAAGSAQTIDKNVGQYYREFIHPYRGSYGPGAEVNRFFPALADKDFHTKAAYRPYLDYFTLPNNERYYDFVWGPVQVFVLNSETHEPDGAKYPSKQATWLQQRLAASTALWKLVVCHHPPYGTRASYKRMQWPFGAWGAQFVSSGQSHVYERIVRDGVTYFINGLGGKSGGDFDGLTPVGGSQVRYGDDYGAQLVTADEYSITFQFFTRAGLLIDSYTVQR